jgi:hypothetical protein
MRLSTFLQTKLRSKLNAAITAPRKLRKPNPLGQSAVNLVDSRGRAGKNATKGFGNIFVTRQAEEAGMDGSSVGSVSAAGKSLDALCAFYSGGGDGYRDSHLSMSVFLPPLAVQCTAH